MDYLLMFIDGLLRFIAVYCGLLRFIAFYCSISWVGVLILNCSL
jgi:hypothetical protein